MAKMKRKNPYNIKGTNIVTATAETEWCKLLKSQLDTGEYSPRGQYSVNLLFDPDSEEFKVFKAKIENIVDTAYNEAKNGEGEVKLKTAKVKNLKKVLPFKEHIPSVKNEETGEWEEGEPSGKIFITARMKNVLDKKPGQDYVKIIGGDNKEIPRDECPEIGNGSKVKAKIYFNPYYMPTTDTIGVSLILSAVKIIDLVEYSSGGSGEDFDEDDGGYIPEGTDNIFDDNYKDEDSEEGDY